MVGICCDVAAALQDRCDGEIPSVSAEGAGASGRSDASGSGEVPAAEEVTIWEPLH